MIFAILKTVYKRRFTWLFFVYLKTWAQSWHLWKISYNIRNATITIYLIMFHTISENYRKNRLVHRKIHNGGLQRGKNIADYSL